MKYIVIGGSNGIGSALVKKLKTEGHNVIIYDCIEPAYPLDNCIFKKIDLFKDDVQLMKNDIDECNGIYITAGIGRVCRYNDLSLVEIEKNIRVNFESISKIVFLSKDKLFSKVNFNCMIMCSIAGLVSSPLFSIYSATKAALFKYIEAINCELRMSKIRNRICCVIATAIKNTSFNGGKTDISFLEDLAVDVLNATDEKKEIYYVNKPLVDKIIADYLSDSIAFGKNSYDYKITNSRLNQTNPIKIGYLSGTFDLFHIGHLNLLKRAKEKCDYLIVGVHKDASHKGKDAFIPFEERCEIVKSIKYVDLVVESSKEDSDDWFKYKYDCLFVGSDYYGSDRFERYEQFFKDKNVNIIYFPYTKGTSSTKLREALSNNDKK